MTNDQITALIQQGRGLQQSGDAPRAASAFTQAGVLLLQQQRHGEAVEAFRHAIEVHPPHGLAHSYLALIAWERNELQEAELHALRGLQFGPGCAKARQALGLVAFSRHQMDRCVRELEKALESEPDLMPARNYLAIALGRLGRHEESLRHCELALTLHPGNPHAHFNRATSLLAVERFREGWLEYEWRFGTGQVARPQIPRPRWDGSPLGGRSILVHTEQGKGDVFQFIRLLPILKEMGGRVVLASQTALQPILSRCAGIDEFFPIDQSAPITFDLYTPLLSLPGLLQIDLSNVPSNVPYVFPDPGRVDRWREVLEGIDGLKIGICWQGSSTFIGDVFRSIPLEQFASLAELPDVTLISLQKDDGVDQVQEAQKRFALVTLDGLDETGGAFEDTAAVMQGLDLVISSDTACLHLAGALGVPTWAALSASADWRWLRQRSDSPWYPTMRLFRQSTLGDWAGVFKSMCAALKQQR